MKRRVRAKPFILRAGIFGAAVLLVACGPTDNTDSKAADAKAPASDEKSEGKLEVAADDDQGAMTAEGGTTPPKLDEAMKAHFDRATMIKQAVIDGDLEAIASPSKWLTDELPVASMPEAWRPHLVQMQSAAKRAGQAKDLLAAGEAAGQLISTCGACHQSVGKGPKFPQPLPVPEGDDTTNRMQRHQWAADRMWEGMVGRSEEHWQLGAGAVSEKPPTPCPIPDEHVLPSEALNLREKIYELGATAKTAEGWEARGKIYGEYLTTCAGCHVGGC